VNPDGSETFRLARLLLLLSVAEELDAERLGVYDFLAEHPLLLARADNDPDRNALRLAGFDDRALAYASPAQRFITAQLALRDDLATLTRRGLVTTRATGRVRYRLTPDGATIAGRFASRYAHRYTEAARVIVRRSRRMSGRRLRANLRRWLTAMPLAGPLPEDVT
jgi:hypothetical protein